jgi:hypothetical protein
MAFFYPNTGAAVASRTIITTSTTSATSAGSPLRVTRPPPTSVGDPGASRPFAAFHPTPLRPFWDSEDAGASVEGADKVLVRFAQPGSGHMSRTLWRGLRRLRSFENHPSTHSDKEDRIRDYLTRGPPKLVL